jgi:hypothetical protein
MRIISMAYLLKKGNLVKKAVGPEVLTIANKALKTLTGIPGMRGLALPGKSSKRAYILAKEVERTGKKPFMFYPPAEDIAIGERAARKKGLIVMSDKADRGFKRHEITHYMQNQKGKYPKAMESSMEGLKDTVKMEAEAYRQQYRTPGTFLGKLNRSNSKVKRGIGKVLSAPLIASGAANSTMANYMMKASK